MSDTVQPTIATSDLPASFAANTDEGHTLSPTNEIDRSKLEKQLAHRPEKTELVEKNILKNSSAAPALQAAEAELKRAKLEDQLGAALQKRPDPAELIKTGILHPDEAPPA